MAVDTGQQMQQLYQRFGELPGVVIELHKELLAVHIQNDAATATVFLQGAQLSQYQAKGQPASIWCSDSCDYKAGSPLRGGIPICWPWFGDFDRNPKTVHGFRVSVEITKPGPANRDATAQRATGFIVAGIATPNRGGLSLSLILTELGAL